MVTVSQKAFQRVKVIESAVAGRQSRRIGQLREASACDDWRIIAIELIDRNRGLERYLFSTVENCFLL